MKLTSNPNHWFMAGLALAAACSGALWALVMTHTTPPLGLVICLLALALAAVFCFGAAEDLLLSRHQPSQEPPEFGPAQYAGPERRRGSRRPPERLVLVVNQVPEDAPRQAAGDS